MIKKYRKFCEEIDTISRNLSNEIRKDFKMSKEMKNIVNYKDLSVRKILYCFIIALQDLNLIFTTEYFCNVFRSAFQNKEDYKRRDLLDDIDFTIDYLKSVSFSSMKDIESYWRIISYPMKQFWKVTDAIP